MILWILKNISVMVVVCLFSNLAWSQWTKAPEDELKVRMGLIIPRYNLEMQAPTDVSGLKATFEPHTPTKTALGLSYRNIGLGVAVSNATNGSDDAKFGTSTSTDIQIRFFGHRTYEFFYQSYSGYYLKNSSDLDSTYSGRDDKIKRPDMNSKNYGVNFFWNLNEESFSQALAFDQAGWPQQNDWGVSWLIHLSESTISGDSAFIPPAAASQFGSMAEVNGVRRQSLASGFGLGGLSTWNKFYATGMLSLGLGYQKAQLNYLNRDSDQFNNLGSYLSLRVGLGYNGEKNVFGLQMFNDVLNTPVGKGTIAGVSMSLHLFYAYRFNGVNLPLANKVSSWLD